MTNKERKEQAVAVRKQLVEEGLLEHAHDANGKPIYKKGKPVWRVTEKGKQAMAEGDPEDFLPS